MEDLFAAQGVVVSYEAIRAWIKRFGPKMQHSSGGTGRSRPTRGI
jgi:transposase-like protein